MGNFLAFASVTSTINYILEEVNRDVAGIKITTKPLDAIDTQNPVNSLNIFLYLVSPTSSVDAVDTLITDNKGQPMNNPILSLDLHYIITATSSENDDLASQKILASAMRILNNHPVLVQDLIRKAVRNKEGLESSDLADQVEDVRLTLNALSTEDLTKIWARFPNANFRPSVAYVAQVVLLESKIIEPAGAIGSVGLDKIGQLASPTIERIEPQILEYAPDASILILGNNLRAPGVSVELGDTLVIPLDSDAISDKRVIVKIPTEIEPGIIRVRINHYLSSERDERTEVGKRSVLKSNTSPFVLAPRILSPRQGQVSRGSEVPLEFEPSVSKGKTILVYLGDRTIPATLDKEKFASDSRIGSVRVNIPNDVDRGVFILRIAIDNAMSSIIIDNNPRSPTFGKSISPYLEVI